MKIAQNILEYAVEYDSTENDALMQGVEASAIEFVKRVNIYRRA